MMYRRALTAFVLLLSLSTAHAGLEEGMVAYKEAKFKTALREWQPLAEKGNAIAQYRVAFMFENEQGVDKDMPKAIQLYKMAADQGNVDAQYRLGLLYEQGAVKAGSRFENDFNATLWYDKAAKQNHAGAWFRYGLLCLDGRGGCKQDADTAMRMFASAARDGYGPAFTAIGWLLDQEGPQWVKENGVEKDVVLTIVYYNLAIEAGLETPIKYRDKAVQRASASQIQEAREIQAAWKVGMPLPFESKLGRYQK